MAEFTIISPMGTQLPLVENEYFHLIRLDGQTEFAASISSTAGGGKDGATVNSVATNPRPLIVTLRIRPDVNVEDAKRYVFRFVKPKQNHEIVWRQNNRTLTITGFCEAATMGRWDNGVALQITFFCDQPYWEDAESVVQEISDIIPLHYFTATIGDMLYFDNDTTGIVMGEYDTARTRSYTNFGDVAVGLEIVIHALSAATNPTIYAATDKFIGLQGVTLAAGERVTITTHRGNKDIVKNGVSIIDKIKPGSTWLEMETGVNTFTITAEEADTDNMFFEIIYKQRYV